jgi:hypothetical protein
VLHLKASESRASRRAIGGSVIGSSSHSVRIALTNLIVLTNLKESSFRYMQQSNPTTPKPILKLKPGVRKSPPETKAAPQLKPQSKLSQKSGAAWSDEYKQQMQADMDALIRR